MKVPGWGESDPWGEGCSIVVCTYSESRAPLNRAPSSLTLVTQIRMIRMIASLMLFALLALHAQITPTLEVASVKPSGAATGSSSGIYTGQGRIDAHNVTLKRCIIGAYRVGPNQVIGGPSWLDDDRYDILAKADQPVDGDEALMNMLQTILADRFQLKLHREQRPMTAYILEVAKNGPKLEKSEDGNSDTNTTGSNTGISIDARGATMDRLTQILAREVDLPILNRTGLDGAFNFTLKWTPQRLQQSAGPDGISIFTAIQEQLGLRLRAEKVPVEVIVIDSAEKPSEN